MNLVDPLKQPQRFVQQANALIQASVAHPGGTDPGDAIASRMEASFEHVLAGMWPESAPAAHPTTPAAPPLAASAASHETVLGVGGPMLGALTGRQAPAAFATPPELTASPLGSLASAARAPGGLPDPDGRMAALSPLIEEMSGRYDVPSWLVHNVIRAESAGNPHATSPVGAMGLMQLMPGTARELGVLDAYDPRQNIEAGTKYLGRLLAQFGGDPQKAVAAYNAGPGAVAHYDGVPPFGETQAYVKRVLGRS